MEMLRVAAEDGLLVTGVNEAAELIIAGGGKDFTSPAGAATFEDLKRRGLVVHKKGDLYVASASGIEELRNLGAAQVLRQGKRFVEGEVEDVALGEGGGVLVVEDPVGRRGPVAI
jgi:hypothetical protein